MVVVTARRSLAEASPSEVRRHMTDYVATGLIYGAALLGCSLLLIILGYVVVKGLPALNLAFFTERPLPFGEVGGGVAPAILGTLIMLAVAALIAVPVGMATAIYLSEFGRGRLASVIRLAVDLLAGLPSIVV